MVRDAGPTIARCKEHDFTAARCRENSDPIRHRTSLFAEKEIRFRIPASPLSGHLLLLEVMLVLLVAVPTWRLDPALACPTTKGQLRRDVSYFGSVRTDVLRSDAAKFPVNAIFADLTPQRTGPIGVSELAEELFSVNTISMQTGIFRTPVMAFLCKAARLELARRLVHPLLNTTRHSLTHTPVVLTASLLSDGSRDLILAAADERGWRQNFEAMGFPGPDKEFAELSDFFGPVADGGVVVDVSCGSGLMSRRLVSSGRYSRVLALDYSEEMLLETCRRFEAEGVSTESVSLVRADAAELPLGSSAVDAVHAGAALHCWPRLEQSLAEVARSLKPRGRFFATTFFEGAMPGRQAQAQPGAMRLFKDEAELRGLLVNAGFNADTLEVRREGRACAIIRAEA